MLPGLRDRDAGYGLVRTAQAQGDKIRGSAHHRRLWETRAIKDVEYCRKRLQRIEKESTARPPLAYSTSIAHMSAPKYYYYFLHALAVYFKLRVPKNNIDVRISSQKLSVPPPLTPASAKPPGVYSGTVAYVRPHPSKMRNMFDFLTFARHLVWNHILIRKPVACYVVGDQGERRVCLLDEGTRNDGKRVGYHRVPSGIGVRFY